MKYSEFYKLNYNDIVEDKYKQLWQAKTKYKSGDVVLYCPETREYTEVHFEEISVYNKS